MTFNELFQRYRAGTATEEERRTVEAELDKAALINDYLFGKWETDPPEAPAAEFKQVKRSLRKRNVALVLTSVVLVIAMLLCIPLVDRQYFDPTRVTWSSIRSDLNIALNCYYSLFAPQQTFEGIWNYTDTGFGTWALELRYRDWDVPGNSTYRTATVDKNEIRFPRNTLLFAAPELFEMGPLAPDYLGNWQENVLADLDRTFLDIDENANVYAAVSFAEDLTVEELFALYKNHLITWAGVRFGPASDPTTPLVGISLNMFFEDCGVNADYPALEGEVTAENAEQHFRSMVEYVRDYEQTTMNIGVIEDPDYYDKVLAELDENGLRFFGCYMYASPETYRELAEAGYITELHVLDVQEHATTPYFAPSFGG